MILLFTTQISTPNLNLKIKLWQQFLKFKIAWGQESYEREWMEILSIKGPDHLFCVDF